MDLKEYLIKNLQVNARILFQKNLNMEGGKSPFIFLEKSKTLSHFPFKHILF